MVPFAAKFGHTPEELANDRELEDALMDEYARSYGHEPTDNWILVIHGDDTSDFYSFDDPTEMWCCQQKRDIRRRLGGEMHIAADGPAQERPPAQTGPATGSDPLG